MKCLIDSFLTWTFNQPMPEPHCVSYNALQPDSLAVEMTSVWKLTADDRLLCLIIFVVKQVCLCVSYWHYGI